MDQAVIVETTFLIDLAREHDGGGPAGARMFLESHQGASLYMPFVVPGELAAGAPAAARAQWEALVAPFYLLPYTPEVGWEFGRAFRHLQGIGQLIGTNDLWIAATALAYEMPIVTRHVERYRRVPHVEVLSY